MPITLVALAAAVAALVQALIALVVKAPAVHPHWARPVSAGVLALAAVLSLGVGRLRTGEASSDRVRALRWATLVVAVAAVGVAVAAGVVNA